MGPNRWMSACRWPRMWSLTLEIIFVGSMNMKPSSTLLAATSTSSYKQRAFSSYQRMIEGLTHQVLFKVINLWHPQQGSQFTNCFPKVEGVWITDVIGVKWVCLYNGLELSPNQWPSVLHDVPCTNRGNIQSINICWLQPNCIFFLLFSCPFCVTEVPIVLHNSKQDCVENLNWWVLCWVKAY